MKKIAPSILAADFMKLGEEIKSIENADYLHFDVMDGSFVPNIALGVPVLKSVREGTDMIIDAHLMVSEPIRYIDAFAKAGSDIITIHVEADQPQNTIEALKKIRAAGKKAGISLKPKTPAETIIPYLPLLDLVLVMTVEPGFGGQSFMKDMLPKITAIRKMIDEGGYDCEIEVDGGINKETLEMCYEAGANVFVAGTQVFRADNRKEFIELLRG